MSEGHVPRKRRGRKAAKPQGKRPIGELRARIREGRELAQSAAAATAEVPVAVLSYHDLVRSAGGRGDTRVLVNYLRHEATPYHRLLRKFPRARAALKRKTLDAIAAAYPYLREECERQADALLAAT